MTTPSHFNWIDYGKSIAIFLVVLFHTHCDMAVDIPITAFAIPSFLFMSGFVFSYERNPAFFPFAFKRFRQLVIPYLWINVVAYLSWLVVLRHYGADADNGLSWDSPLIGFLTGVPPMLSHDIPLWSLLCFFVVEIIFYPLGKTLMSDIAVALIFAVAAFVLSQTVDASRWPFTLGPAVAGVAFYALGHSYRRFAPKWRSRRFALLFFLSLPLFVIGVSFNTKVDFFICSFGNYGLFMLGALSGIVMFVALTTIIGRHINEPRAINFIARSTLIICGFHLLAFAVIKAVFLFGFGIQPDVLTDGIIKGILFASVALLLTLPVSYIVFRYFPWLVDKSSLTFHRRP